MRRANLCNSMSDEEANLPSAKECQKRVEQFVELTQTDEMMAQFYLQDRDWSVERSVQAFFDEKTNAANVDTRGGDSSVESVSDDDTDGSPPSNKKSKPSTGGDAGVSSDSHPPGNSMKDLSFITWNIDGLGEKNRKERTKAVIQTVLERNPDVVFFQEVIPETLAWLKAALDSKYLFGNGEEGAGYFTAVLLKRSTVYRDSIQVIEFPDTVMGRDLTLVEADIADNKFLFINTHLESTKDFASVRMEQLKRAFGHMSKADARRTVILAGDLNIRDKEVASVGLPDKVQDVWVATGSRKEVEHTWDTLRNTNTEIPGKFKPRMRFDRVYLRPSDGDNVKPEHFGLVGIQKVVGHQVFPSDHWGIYCVFKLLKLSK